MAIMPPTGFDDETVAWGYAPPSHLEGEPEVPIPANKPGLEIAPNQPVRLDSGVVAYRETLGHRQRMMELDRQAAAARQAAQQAAMDAKMFEQMSRVAKSTKDIEIARRSIDVMGLQRDIQNGVPIHQAVARHPMALGGGFGPALRATAPTAAPTRLDIAGMPPAVMAGGRPYWPPASAMPAEPLSTKGEALVDETGKKLATGFATGPRSRTIIREPSVSVRPGSLTAVENAIIRGLDKEITEKNKALEKASSSSAKYLELVRDLEGLSRRRNQILTEAGNRGPTSTITSNSTSAAAPATPAKPAAPVERVVVRDKSGKQFTVPKDQLQQAIAEGYTPIE